MIITTVTRHALFDTLREERNTISHGRMSQIVHKANALDALPPVKLASLGPGKAYVWSSKATDDVFTRGAVKVRCRPRVTQHGGGTKSAVAPVDQQVLGR